MSRTERARCLFLAHSGQWISSYTLERVAGRMAWRTRVSDVRRLLKSTGSIQNRLRRSPHGHTISEYRYVPHTHDAPDFPLIDMMEGP